MLVFIAGIAAASSQPAPGRDPGPVDVRGRSAMTPRPSSVTQRPTTPEPRERRRLYEQVEEAVDRGNGRVEDEQTHQVRRLRDDRDARLGRVKPQREVERLDEEQDRRRRIERRRAERPREEGRPSAGAGRPQARPPTSIEETPNPGGSTMARFAEEQSKLLSAAQERYQRDLAEAEARRDEAVAAAETREGVALARRRFDERRSELTRQYGQYRRKILGTDSAPR